MKRLFLWGGFVLLSILATLFLPTSPMDGAFYLHVLFLLSGNALFYILSLWNQEDEAEYDKRSSVLLLTSVAILVLMSRRYPFLLAMLPGLFFLLPAIFLIRIACGLAFITIFVLYALCPYTVTLLVLTFFSNYMADLWRTDHKRLKETLYALDEETQRSNLLHRRYLALEESQGLLQSNAILQERQRIARDIHDHVGHDLTSAILQLKALEYRLEDPSWILPIRALLQESMTQVRNSVHNLHDQSLHLTDEIQLLLDQYTFCPVYAELHLQTEPPGAVHFALLAAIKEALKNTATHSNATKVEILLSETAKLYRLLLVDNGTNAIAHPEAGAGLGLLSLRQRVEALSGSMHISVENGFHLFITLPKEGK